MKLTIYVITALFLSFFLLSRDGYGETYGRLIKRGNRYYKNELYSDALRYYNEGGDKNPEVLEPLFNRGDALYKTEDYRNSIESFERSLDLIRNDGQRADILYNLGNSYFMAGEYAKSIESYVKGLELNPTNLNMKYNLELAQKRLNEVKQKQEKESGGKGKSQEKQPDEDSQDTSSGEGEQGDSSDGEGKDQQDEKGDPQEGTNESSDPRELSREEAERLLTSVNREQVEIINEIIQQRVRGEETEKDW
jgi:Ca-activated chloride channel family protein